MVVVSVQDAISMISFKFKVPVPIPGLRGEDDGSLLLP